MKTGKPYPNRYFGKKLIKNPGRIVELADQKKCVLFRIDSKFKKIPAAFVQNWQLRLVVKHIKFDRLYELDKKNQSTKSNG